MQINVLHPLHASEFLLLIKILLWSAHKKIPSHNSFFSQVFPEVAGGRISSLLHKEKRVYLFFCRLRLISTVRLLEPGPLSWSFLAGELFLARLQPSINARGRKPKQLYKERDIKQTHLRGFVGATEGCGDRVEITNAGWRGASEASKYNHRYYYDTPPWETWGKKKKATPSIWKGWDPFPSSCWETRRQASRQGTTPHPSPAKASSPGGK